MFNDPGKKVKIVANVFFWLVAAGGVLTAVFLAINMEAWEYVLIAPGAVLVAWLFGRFIYAFGEAVESLTALKNRSGSAIAPAGTDSHAVVMAQGAALRQEIAEEAARYEQMYRDGVITKSEYKKITGRLRDLM